MCWSKDDQLFATANFRPVYILVVEFEAYRKHPKAYCLL